MFLAGLLLFGLQAIVIATELLKLAPERVSLRLDSRVLVLKGFQPGDQPLVFLANRRKLVG